MLYKLVTNWKETPTLEEEKMFGIIKEKVKKGRLEIALSMKYKKKDDMKMTEKTAMKTSPHTDSDGASQIAPYSAAQTIERFPVKHNVPEKAIVSKQTAKIFITKPQQVNPSVEI
jgi:hypothetical protein